MDELESLLAFVDIEISLVEGLEYISEIEAQYLENLNSWTDYALNILEDKTA